GWFLLGVDALLNLAGPNVAAIVHAEVDGEGGGLVGEDIAFEASVAAAGGIAADAYVAEGEVVGREARLAPDFDVVGVKPLLGDAVAHDDDDVVFLEEEILGRRGWGGHQDEHEERVENAWRHDWSFREARLEVLLLKWS